MSKFPLSSGSQTGNSTKLDADFEDAGSDAERLSGGLSTFTVGGTEAETVLAGWGMGEFLIRSSKTCPLSAGNMKAS
jgi:hypothetical protein